MNLVIALDQLQKARQFVRDGKRYLTQQRKTVDALKRNGRDAGIATSYLEQLEEMQLKYEEHRDLLEERLKADYD